MVPSSSALVSIRLPIWSLMEPPALKNSHLATVEGYKRKLLWCQPSSHFRPVETELIRTIGVLPMRSRTLSLILKKVWGSNSRLSTHTLTYSSNAVQEACFLKKNPLKRMTSKGPPQIIPKQFAAPCCTSIYTPILPLISPIFHHPQNNPNTAFQ